MAQYTSLRMYFATSNLCAKCGGTGLVESEMPPYKLGPSPVPLLVGTNDTPSESQADAIRNTMSEVQPFVSALDADIAQVQAKLMELQLKREILHNYFHEHERLLSPIRWLPADLLGDIFIFCLPERWQDRRFEGSIAPLLLTKICRHWRAAAVSTARLWSSFVYESQSPSDVALTKLWLTRGINCAMNIRIAQPFVDLQYGTCVVQVLNLLVSHSERWREVDIFLQSWMLSAVATVKDRLPLLQTLTIDGRGPFDDQLIDGFESAPMLRGLRLSLPNSNGPRLLNFPWAQLDKLAVAGHNFGPTLAGLNHAAVLTDLRLTAIFSCNPVPTNVIHLNQLHSLYLQFINWVALDYLLPFLVSPALKDICIAQHERMGFPVWVCHEAFVSFLSQSSCSLRRIAFHNVPLDSSHLLQYMEYSPTLVDLVLRGIASHSITDNVIHRLTYQDTEGAQEECLAPALQFINIEAYHALSQSLFLDMVQSRMHIRTNNPVAVSRLRKLTITLPYEDENFEPIVFSQARVRQLRDDGLDISIVQPSKAKSSVV
jgi:hypothetical protein